MDPSLALAPFRAQSALVVFGLTYVVLGFGALPPLRIDRTGATLVGATAMIGLGVLTPREAAAAIDLPTLALLFGMMVLTAHLRLAGFFGWMGSGTLRWAHTPRTLLAVTATASAVLSALFVNDTVCLLMTPVVLAAAESIGVTPTPFLLAVAMGANVGSVATIVGNPQNMLVASASGIGYSRFASRLAPVAAAGLAITILVLLVLFRRPLAPRAVTPASPTVHLHRPLLVKSLGVGAGLLIALLAGAPPAIAALLAASALLITRRIRPTRVYAQVDWSLLAMFAGLFVVVEGVERAGLSAWLLDRLGDRARHSLPAFVAVTAALSNVVSNVPAVLVLRGWAAAFPDPERAWLALAMASTLAGNLTLVGSVANLIVVEQARGRARVGFWDYLRAGIPITLATLAIGTLVLMLAPG